MLSDADIWVYVHIFILPWQVESGWEGSTVRRFPLVPGADPGLSCGRAVFILRRGKQSVGTPLETSTGAFLCTLLS